MKKTLFILVVLFGALVLAVGIPWRYIIFFAVLTAVWWFVYSKRCPKCKKGRALEKTEVRDQWKCKYCGHSEFRGYDIGEKG